MTHAITLPQLGESVTEGVITAWLVEVGDELEVDQPLAEVATDKVDTEIPAPLAGRVHALRVEVDETVEVGQVIAEVVVDGEATDDGPDVPDGDVADDQAQDGAAATGPASPRGAASRADRATVDSDTGPRLSPKVRRLLRERSLDPSAVVGTGHGGRITPHDVEAAGAPAGANAGASAGANANVATATRSATPAASHRSASDSAPRRPASATTPQRTSTDGRSETLPLPRIRRTIADHMHRSLQTTAQLTSVVEVDMTRLMASRARAKDAVRSREGVSLTPLALTARAVCDVLARHPVINAQIDTEAGTATYHRDVHLGVAVDTDAGLIVPTIRGAQDLTVVALARRIADLAERSRGGGLSPDDVTGGTFTITNTGSRGVLLDTPILNPPQVAILATTLIEKRPVVVTDELGMDALAIRQMSYLCLTYDHRLVDGADAARFLGDLKHTLETRELLPEFAATHSER